MVESFWSFTSLPFACTQEDLTPKRVVEVVEMLRRGEKPPVSKNGQKYWAYFGVLSQNNTFFI